MLKDALEHRGYGVQKKSGATGQKRYLHCKLPRNDFKVLILAKLFIFIIRLKIIKDELVFAK